MSSIFQFLREKMIHALKIQFTQQDYDFLKSFKEGTPDWSLSPDANIQNLPAVKWKLQNIRRMPNQKHKQALKKLEDTLLDWI